MVYSVVTDRIFWLRHKFMMLLFILSGFMHSEAHAADRINSPDQDNISPYEHVKQAGYTLKKKRVNTLTLSYAEGPDNGPPLVLLHVQLLDWFSYYPVLSELSKFFHVYDIDYPGHGQTVTPPDYPMTAQQIGSDLSEFIQQTIKKPVYISGNSSGGLLAVWMAANRPQQIMSAILEDPPLFSSEYPRIKKTIAYRAFETSFTAVTQDHPVDFLLYWIHHNAQFFRKNIGPGTPFLLTQAVRAYRWRDPGTPVTLDILSNDTVRMLIRGLDQYDPRFGAAFYDGSWNRGFSHAEALARIQCPVMLIQANYSVLKDGTLDGAMSKEEAMRAMSLLRNGTYLRIDATHVVNIDKPDEFIRAIKKFLLEKG